ncbi:uncharacterized protein RHO25_013105 [Cercospora beticola]|uniref:Uncharacterized protein n=1 Tax=Cercospora beticola TaxID=122368 RepID=A0ABZ0P944_CERBT|nr:hypothetical protein RHO25_013105 [Cercospora beticola]
MKSSRRTLTFVATALSQLAFAQDKDFNNNAKIPTTCSNGFESRSDTVFLTLPYSYDSVAPLVSDFSNLSWANISPVTLNGTNNTPGTARAFSFGGADFIPKESVEEDGKTNFTLWLESLRFEVEGVCGGRASQVNWTVSLCSDVPDVAKGMLHMVHTGFVENVGKLLGGGTFESCEGLEGGEGGKEGGGESGKKEAEEGKEEKDEDKDEKEGEKDKDEDEDEDEEEEDEDEEEEDEDEKEDEKDEKDEDGKEDEEEGGEEEEDEEEDKKEDGKKGGKDEKDGEKEKAGKKKKPSQSYGEPSHYRRWVA